MHTGISGKMAPSDPKRLKMAQTKEKRKEKMKRRKGEAVVKLPVLLFSVSGCLLFDLCPMRCPDKDQQDVAII